MGSRLEARVAQSAQHFAAQLVAELRRAGIEEILALASEHPRARVALGELAAEPAREPALRSSAVEKQRILRAVKDLVAKHGLTEREEFMLERVAYGSLRADLARATKLAMQTTKMHIRALLRKLDAENLGEVRARILHRAASYV